MQGFFCAPLNLLLVFRIANLFRFWVEGIGCPWWRPFDDYVRVCVGLTVYIIVMKCVVFLVYEEEISRNLLKD